MTQSHFAVTYTIKNEAEWLGDALAYHLAIGAYRIYLFFDGTTDGSREIARRFDKVWCRDTVLLSEIPNPPQWINAIAGGLDENMDRRKRLNTYFAATQAADEGIDWIINIDVDELLVADWRAKEIVPGCINAVLEAIPDGVDQVFFRNFEVISRPIARNPFRDSTLFLRPFRVFWFTSKLMSAHRFVPGLGKAVPAVVDLAFKWRLKGAIRSIWPDPFSGRSVTRSYYTGYYDRKSFVRVRAVPRMVFNIHWWQEANNRRVGVWRGALLHYNLPDFQYFLSKYRQRSAGNAYSTNILARVARELPEDVARDYFEREICIGEKELQTLRSVGAAVMIDTPARFLASLTIDGVGG